MSNKWDRKRPLTQKELEDAIANLSDSEDDFDFDSDFEGCGSDLEDVETFNIEDMPLEFEDGTVLCHDNIQRDDHVQSFSANEDENSVEEQCVMPQQALKEMRKKFSKIIWRKQNLILSDEASSFQGITALPSSLSNLETPFEVFNYFFDETLFEKIAEQSNLYAIQKDVNKPASLTSNDIKQFLGICIYMSVVHMPNIRSYWSTKLGFPQIKATMSQNRFEFIKKNLHFNDNSKMIVRENPNHDRLHKLRPIIEALLTKFQSVTLDKCLSVDEQLCATKARHHLKQYLPAKPHKWGYKLYVLCGTDGFSYNFEIYTGDENDPKFRLSDEPDLGSSANIVVRLCRIVPTNKNYRVYFDNFYTSVPLLVYLGNRGIYTLGTARRPRIPNCKLPTEKELKKDVRGTSYEFVCNIDGVDVSSLLWLDNKPVIFLSTFKGKMPLGEVKRWDRKTKKYINIECPSLVPEYNSHMGGVDAMDSYIGRNKMKLRSKKWYIRLFYHLVDMTLVNTWLLHKRIGNQTVQSQVDVRLEIAECLCKIGSGGQKRGRPSKDSIVENLLSEKRKKSTVFSHVPPKDVRTDSIGHWPKYEEVRQRCKFPTCNNSFSHFKCSKCGVHLCLNKNNNCFMRFHEP